MQQELYTETLKELRATYKGKTLLDIKEVANVLGVSDKTIRTGVKMGRGVPSFRNVGYGGTRKHTRFPIIEVARFVADTQRVY